MLVSGLLAGLILGLASGGNWRNLQRFDLELWPGLLAGVIARTAAPFLGALALSASAPRKGATVRAITPARSPGHSSKSNL